MIVIGLTGKAGAGKGVAADHLVAEHGFTKLSFAGPLKKMLRTLDPIVEGSFSGVPERLSDVFGHYGDDEADVKLSEYGPEYRRLLQVLGTDCIRAVDEGFWVRAALAQLTDYNEGRYVFDDVRFPNEAAAIRMQEWSADPDSFDTSTLWRIERPDHDGGAGNHVSEQHAATIAVDRVLQNPQSIPYLLGQVDTYAEDLLEGA